LPQITGAGGSLAVISPQVARTPRETEEPQPFTYEMLRDFGNRVAESYGLVFTLPDDLREIYTKFGIDLARGNGDADPDYTRRPEPADTVKILEGLRRP